MAFRNNFLYSETGESVTPIELYDDCNIDRSNTLTFKIILIMGVVFVAISALISFYINKVDRRKLLSKKLLSYVWNFVYSFVLFVFVWASISVGWLLICSGFSVSISLLPHFYLMAICFMVFLSCGLCGGIISAISIAIFPTNIR